MRKEKRIMVRFTEEEYEWLQAVAPDGKISPYIRNTILRHSKNDLKLLNMDDRLLEIAQNVRASADLLGDLFNRVVDHPQGQERIISQESQKPGGIPDEMVGIVLEMLLLTRNYSDTQAIKMAQGQVERLGLPVWEG